MKSYLIFLSCFLGLTSLWGQRQPISNPLGGLGPGVIQNYQLCQEQDCPRANQIVLTTGLDTNGDPIAPASGAVDPHWKLINNPPLDLNSGCLLNWNTLGPSLNGNAYVVNYNNASPWVNQAGAGVLAPFNGGSNLNFGCNNAVNTYGDRVPYIFQREFCVCSRTWVQLDFTFKGDDKVSFQLINLNTGQTYLNPEPQGGFFTAQSYTNALFLEPGIYVLRAYLQNTINQTLGFSLKGEIKAPLEASPFLLAKVNVLPIP